MESVTVYNKKHKKFLQSRYSITGDGAAFENMMQFRNYCFFHSIKFTKTQRCAVGTILYTDKNIYTRAAGELKLSGSVAENANDILVLQNGDYVLQQYKDKKLTSLYSGEHKNAGLKIDYFFATKLLSKVNFKKFDKNIKRDATDIVIIDFIDSSESFIAKNTTISVDSILSPDDKKLFIRQYKDKYKNAVIMHNNNIFYILKG